MDQTQSSRRHFLAHIALGLGAAPLAGCGGGGGGDGNADAASASAADAAEAAAARSRLTPTAPVPVPAPVPSNLGPQVATLQVVATKTGTFAYSATVLPLRGQMPAGSRLMSPTDALLDHAVLTTWDDGSAATVIATGSVQVAAGRTSALALHLPAVTASKVAAVATPLTAAHVQRAVQRMELNFGALGLAALTDFSAPERIWWATANVICARYRLGLPAHRTLQAVIDVHAYVNGTALVEVVVENCLMDTRAPAWPDDASYTGATILVNGRALTAAVSSTSAPERMHLCFRSWYASGWVGEPPALRVTQHHLELQRHPLLFKCARDSNADLSMYADDQYKPWDAGRMRGRDMGSTGDHPSIGPVTRWDAQFLQSGDTRAAQATEAATLSVLNFQINYRDVNSGLVPDFDLIGARDQQGSNPGWLRLGHPDNVQTWEVAHHPAAGFMAFVARPSPVFIEIAQKVAVWNGTWSGANNNFEWTAGTHGHWYQMRGRAWCLRSLVHAAFLTPTSHPWRAAGATAIHNNAKLFDRWRQDTRAKLNTMWDYLPDVNIQDGSGARGFQTSMWGYHFLVHELHKAASVKLLAGEQQRLLDGVADWAAMQPVRWVNEQTNGGWRYIPYQTCMGRDSATIDSLPTWGEQTAWFYSDQPASVSGPFYVYDGNPQTSYVSSGANTSAGAYYPSYFWTALVAAVERGVPGASQAWSTVQNNLTGLNTWLDGFAADPRWGASPRV